VYCNISAHWVINLSNFKALAKSGVTKYRNTLEDVGKPICNNESMSRDVTKWCTDRQSRREQTLDLILFW
jgi:hypothetical protein